MCHLSFKQWNAFISISNIPYLRMQRGIRGSRQTENWFSTAVCDLNAKYSVVSVPHWFFSLWCSCWDCDRFKVLSSFPLLAFWMVLGCQLNLLALPWGCCLHLRDRSGWEQHWRQDAAAGPYGICGLNYQIGSQVLNWGNILHPLCIKTVGSWKENSSRERRCSETEMKSKRQGERETETDTISDQWFLN